MKTRFALRFTVLFLLSIAQLQAESAPLNLATLTTGNWIRTAILVRTSIKFTSDGHYSLTCEGECGMPSPNKPSFTIDAKGILHLSPDQAEIEFAKPTSCNYQITPKALEYTRTLSCANGFTFSDTTSLSRNMPAEYDGHSLVTLGLRDSLSTDNVKLRTNPSTNAPVIEYCSTKQGYQMIGPVPSELLDCRQFMPKGTSVTVIARTLKRDPIGAWNNFWLLIRFYDFKSSTMITCWAYGEFFKY